MTTRDTFHNADGTVNVLGHKFRPMTDDDYQGLAGAAPDSYIAEVAEGLVLVFEPDTGKVIAIDDEGSEVVWTPSLP